VTDSGLVLVRAGREPQALYALDDRLFIRHGVRGFWVFERDSTGAVKDLVNWRDNNAGLAAATLRPWSYRFCHAARFRSIWRA
jgi:hypothetical protein